MGLLDFLSSKPAKQSNSQGGLVVTPPPSQTYTPQTNPTLQIQKSYKDLQYPMPSNNSQLGTTVLPEANGLKPSVTYATESLPSVKAEQPLPHVETILDNGVRQVNHTEDVQKAAITKLNQQELVPSEGVQNLPYVNLPNPQPLYSYSANPVPADVLVEQAEADEAIAEQNVIEPIPENTPGVTVNVPEQQAQLPTPVADESKNGDIIQVGSAETNPVSNTQQASIITNAPVQDVTPSLQQIQPQQVAELPVIPEISQSIQPLPAVEVAPVVSQQPLATQPKITQEVKTEEIPSLTETIVGPITNNTTLEQSPIVRGEEVETEIETHANIFNVLNKVAFVSLNSQSVNSSLSQKVKSLTIMLKDMGVDFYIDSNKGYGMDIVSGLSGAKNKVIAVYLKPFYSKYSDETNLEVPMENFTKVSFSSFIDKIKYLYREANVFVIPETSGLNSLSQVTLLLSSQSMYFGSHKPVILFGTAWKERINNLKMSFALSQQEVDSMYFASTAEEVVNIIRKLDSEFSNKMVVNTSNIDLRSEESEKEGLLISNH